MNKFWNQLWAVRPTMALTNQNSCLQLRLLPLKNAVDRGRWVLGGIFKEKKKEEFWLSNQESWCIPWFISLFKSKRGNYHLSQVKKNALLHWFYFFPHFNMPNFGVHLTINAILHSCNWQYFFFLKLHKRMQDLKMDNVLESVKSHSIPWNMACFWSMKQY